MTPLITGVCLNVLLDSCSALVFVWGVSISVHGNSLVSAFFLFSFVIFWHQYYVNFFKKILEAFLLYLGRFFFLPFYCEKFQIYTKIDKTV